ncbi:MAG: hypothetical protein WAW37_01000 [Syntrophobacteraceae bacterium]
MSPTPTGADRGNTTWRSARRAIGAPPALPESPARRDRPVLKAPRDHPDQSDHQDQSDQSDLPDHPDHPDPLELPVLPALPDPSALRGRRGWSLPGA